MTRKDFQEKMITFENDLGYHGTFNPIYVIFPVMFLINYIRTKRKRELSRKTYYELLIEIDKIDPPLDPKEYNGWKKRVHSAYNE